MSSNAVFTEERLSTFPKTLEGCPGPGPLVSPALDRVLYSGTVPFVAPVEEPDADPVERHCAVMNDGVGPEFKTVGQFQCSDRGTMWAYVGEDPDLRSKEAGGHRIFERVLHLVVNGQLAGELAGGRFHLSPDGLGEAHPEPVPHPTEPRLKLVRMVLNGKPGPTLMSIKKAAWSRQGVFAYAGDLSVGGGSRVFLAGEPGPTHPRIDDLIWSPDGTRLVCIASEDGVRRSLFINGKAPADHGEPFRVTFSADGKRMAYAAFADGGCRVVVDGEAGPKFEGCLGIEFSPDGRRVAYVAVQQGLQVLVQDHRAGRAYEDVGSPLMSRDGSLLAYGARDGQDQFVVVNGEESERGDLLFRLAAAEEGAAAAWVLKKGGGYRLYNRGVLVRETRERIGPLVLNRDGSKLAWGEGGRIFLDGTPGDLMDGSDEPLFSPDGRTLIYKARRGEESGIRAGDNYHGPMKAWSPFVFNEAGTQVALVAQIGSEIWRKILSIS